MIRIPHFKNIILVSFLTGFIWFIWPIYQFYAYEGEVPMLFPKDVTVPAHLPQSTLFDKHPQSSAALDLLS